MRKLSWIAACLFVTMTVTQSHAQEKQKIGHIDTQELLEAMPEAKAAEQKLADTYKALENKLNTMRGELQAKVDAYREKEAMMPDALKKMEEREIMDLDKRIQEAQVTAQQSYAEESSKIQQPLLEKVQKAIAEVAKENGFSYILDTSGGNILYFEGGINVLPLVKKKLSIP